ncbi:MAG TPA: PAS domain S-box protein [Planctomycetota bacterium]|jgi:PAS domain S-box-containing protein
MSSVVSQDVQRLRAELDKYKLLIETTGTGYVILDAQGNVLDANNEYVRMTGYARLDEILGRNVVEWTAEPDRQRNAAKVEECFARGMVRNLEISYVAKDGRVTPVEINASVLRASNSISILSVCRDITERRRTEDARRASEEKYRELVENANCIILRWACDGHITFINEFGSTFFGYTEAELIGRHVVGAIVPQTESTGRDLRPLMDEICADPKKFERNVNENMRRNGERVWIAWTNKTVFDESGQVKEIFSIGSDITDRKRAEEILKESEARLRQSEKMTAIGQLAGGIAHDFNNQLTGIMGYADMLAARMEDGDLRQFAQNIVVATRRAADLTQKLLAFGRKGKYLSVPVGVHQLLGEAVAILERSIDKRIRIRPILKAEPAVVLGDPSQLENAILNLALNGRDAMPEGGELTFETEVMTLNEEQCRDNPYEIAPGQYLRVAITDTGCGMSDEVKKHLFEPFFTTKKPGQGTGMGLASVYGAVRNHRGTISVYSEVGHGTTVRLCLPLGTAALTPVELHPEMHTPRGTARLLIVDDEEMIRNVAAKMLRSFGYRVETCADGHEAVEYYRAHWQQVDLVILDMVMPQMGGRDAFLAMRQINPGVRALLSSGYSLDGEAQDILDEGVLAFVGKPYRLEELAQSVASALARAL